MVRQTTKVIVFEVLGVLSLLLMAAVGVLAFMLASGPVELGIFRDDVEQALSNSRSGREVTIEELTLQWSPTDRRIFVVASGLSLKDTEGEEAGFAQKANITLDAGAIFLGNFEVIQVDLKDGWINVQNRGANQWTIAGDPIPEIRAGVLPQTPQEWLDRVNTILSDVLVGADSFAQSVALETLGFDDIDFRIIREDNSPIAAVNNASGRLETLDEELSLSLAGNGEGDLLPEIFSFSLNTREQYNALEANLDIGVLPIAVLAQQLGLPGFDQGALTVGTSFNARVSRAEGVQELSLVLASQAGELIVPQINETISRLDAALTYTPQDDSIQIVRLGVESDRLEAVFAGNIENVLATNSLRRIALSSDTVALDLTPMFETAFSVADVSVEADVSDDFSIISFNRATVQLEDEVALQATGELDLQVDAQPGEIPLRLQLTAEVIGEVDKTTILKFWPVRLGDGARQFVINQLLEGTVTGVTATLDLQPDTMAQGFMRDEDLAVSFAFRNGEVKFMPDLPSVRQAIGTGKLTGNSFRANVTSALYDDWDMQTASVDFPVLNPRGQNFTVTAIGSGPAVSAMRNVSESRLQIEAQTGFDPDRISGDARASFKMTRPALAEVEPEDVSIQVKGEIMNGGLQKAVGDLDLVNGRIDVDVTQERMILTGFGDLGNSPVQFTWRDRFDEEQLPADLSASAVITPDLLNMFGLIGRAFLTGEIPVELQGKVGVEGLQKATFAFDLRDARIDVAEIGWVKPAGEAARATLSYSGDLREQSSAVRLQSENAELDGDIRLASDGRLQELILRKLFFKDLADVSGEVQRSESGGFAVTLGGPFLDVSSILGDLGAVGGASGDAGIDFSFDAQVKRLKMRRNLELTDAILSVKSKADGLESLAARGVSANGSSIEALLKSNGPDRASDISVKASDAGFIAEAFFGVDFISGGALDLSGTLATETEPARLVARVRDTRLTNAPFFTQILSLASLRGLTDTLSGEGVLFTNIEVPISIGGGRYVIDGGRASGPALGLTANGWIGTDGEGIELDGVLVPSFGVNSVLGGVPIIGDLIVGREGEGIFSITYNVQGTLEKAQVSVNPLSAVTPGILRRIFENPSDTSIPETLPVDPNLRPPSEKLPDLPDEELLAPTPGSGG